MRDDSIEQLLNAHQRLLLDTLAAAGERGMTDEELQDSLVMLAGVQRPARQALYGMRLIADAGRTRPSRSGRPEVVWVVAKGKPGRPAYDS
jgi:hypothetical protein